jgi:hypothetical protein
LSTSISATELVVPSRLRKMVWVPVSLSGLIQAATVTPPPKVKAGWSGT